TRRASDLEAILYNLHEQSDPKEIIHTISEHMLQTFKEVALINEYDMYQYVMNYWYETMKDDIYMIIEDGWKANEALTPEDLFIERYFKAEQDEITQLEVTINQLEQEKEEVLEEHAGEDSIFEEVKSDAGNITKGNVNKKLRELKNEPEEKENYETLLAYKQLDDDIGKVKKEVKAK